MAGPAPHDAAGPGQHGGLDQDAVSRWFHHRFVLGRKGQEERGGLPLEVHLMLGGVPGHQGPVSSTAKASERSPRPETCPVEPRSGVREDVKGWSHRSLWRGLSPPRERS